MTRFVSDVLRIARNALGRTNENDPQASDSVLLSYLNDFVSLTMSDQIRMFEQFGTLTFTIDESNTTGVYTLDNDPTTGIYIGSGTEFVSISQECYISLLDPVDNSVSWNQLPIYYDPGEFFGMWGINNDEILIPGYPTNMLFYGNEFTFRTIPNTSYLVKIYGYKKHNDFPDANEPLVYDRWLRYLAYGLAYNYAKDYRYEPNALAQIKANFADERNLMLTHTHNQIKMSRACPRF